jgi:hypothetical protein
LIFYFDFLGDPGVLGGSSAVFKDGAFAVSLVRSVI